VTGGRSVGGLQTVLAQLCELLERFDAAVLPGNGRE
jgi:hypothetical protein